MKKILCLTLLALATTLEHSWAIPSQISYQGTLKEQGVPVNATRQMLFRITDANGTQVYWSSGNMSVVVTQGLFSVLLSPLGVNWDQITPYIEISVEGQALSPREPLTATVYAKLAESVADGAVTEAKVASGFGLVPQGAIMLFDKACPTGWTRFAALDNRFPLGALTYGGSGGSASHAHSIASDNAPHSHRAPVLRAQGTVNDYLSPVFGLGPDMGTTTGDALPNGGSFSTHSYPFLTSVENATHDHGGTTGATNSLPPYLSLIYCQRQ